MKMHSWINYIFGVNQNKKEKYSIYPPYTEEQYVKWEEEHTSGLTNDHLLLIPEYGQTPMKTVQELIGQRDPKLYATILRSHISFNFEHSLLNLEYYNLCSALKHKCDALYANYDKILMISGRKLYKSKRKEARYGKFEESAATIETVVPFKGMSNQSAYAFCKRGEYLITCRHPNSVINILKIDTNKPKTIMLQNMVTAVHYSSKTNKLFTGSNIGILGVWHFRKPEKYFNECVVNPRNTYNDHSSPICIITSNKKAEILLTVSKDHLCVVRSLMSLRYCCSFKLKETDSELLEARVSKVGYIVFLMKSKDLQQCFLCVRRFNGDMIKEPIQIDGVCKCFIFDSSGYNVLVSTAKGSPKPIHKLQIINYLNGKVEEYKTIEWEEGPAPSEKMVMMKGTHLILAKKGESVRLINRRTSEK